VPQLHHVRRGSGAPLVLLHGLGMDWRAWEPVLDRLAERHDVIALDAPGFGASAPLPGGAPPTVWALADAIAAFLGELGIARPHVAGNSMGGAIALELARRRVVASATALSPAGFWTDRERDFSRRSLHDGRRLAAALGPRAVRALAATAAGRTLLLGQFVAHPARVSREAAAHIVEAGVAAPAFEDALEAFEHFRFVQGDELRGVPVTVAWGTRDWLLLPREARRVPRALPSADFLWLRGCGHLPMFDDPALVACVLLDGAARAT
jgi:pimeloyl-ACP methyl ester carboxylesterase